MRNEGSRLTNSSGYEFIKRESTILMEAADSAAAADTVATQREHRPRQQSHDPGRDVIALKPTRTLKLNQLLGNYI